MPDTLTPPAGPSARPLSRVILTLILGVVSTILSQAPPAHAATISAEASGLQVTNARVRALIPGQDKTAGYLQITNLNTEPVVLVRAESDSIRAIEFHTTYLDGDVMRMRRLQEVTIEPGSTSTFQPGGHHMMLFGVRSLGATVDIRLLTADGRSLTVSFERIALFEKTGATE